MKLPLRIAQLLLGAGAAFSFAACGDSTNSVDGDAGGAGGDDSSKTCDIPGGSECTASASGRLCPDDGSAAVEFTCASGEVCDDGKCKGQCEPGDTECVGDSVQRVCTADGKSWVEIPCQDGNVCAKGKCGREDGLECTPGAMECDGADTLRTCSDKGKWTDEECPGQTACSDGVCRGSVCAVGATKCDESTLDLPSGFFAEGAEPNFSVIYTCTDGEHWEVTPCPESVDENHDSICTYSGLDQATVNAYRTSAHSWLMQFFNANSNSLPSPAPPTPPAIPAGAKAACTVPDCDWGQAFFETPAQTRYCGTPDGESVEYKSFTQCEGFAPYSNLTAQNYDCKGMTACGDYNGAINGCSPVDCLPGERTCSGDTSYYECNAYSFQFNESFSCPSEPGACAASGSAPSRKVTCDGAPVLTPAAPPAL